MRKTTAYFGFLLGAVVFSGAFVLWVFPSSGDESARMSVMGIAVAMGGLFTCYRAWYHYHNTDEPKGWEGTKQKLEEMQSRGEVLAFFFNPLQMRFRTMWGLVVLLALALFAKPTTAVVVAAIAVITKGWLLWSEMKYQKVYRQLVELNDPSKQIYCHEDASMTVEGRDIVIVDPTWVDLEDELLEQHIEAFENNHLTSEMGFESALSFVVSDYHITDLVDNNGVVVGSWASDSNLVGCFLVDDLLRLNPGFKDYLDNCAVFRNFTGTVTFHFEQKTSPWEYYGEVCEEDSTVLRMEGIGSTNFRSAEVVHYDNR